ncbi:MAG: hypothetical protein QM820_09420 [Minicystis sp.]
MKHGTWHTLIGCALFLGATGCSNTVRYMTATQWINTGPGGAPAAAPAPAASGAPAAPAPAAPVSADDGRTLYLTFWEGSCSSGVLNIGRGCTLGDTHIKRCNVKTDNSLVCVDEPEANRILSREKK